MSNAPEPRPEETDQWGAPSIPPAPQGGIHGQSPPPGDHGPYPYGPYPYASPFGAHPGGPALGASYPPPVAPPPRRRRGWIIAVTIIFILALVCCGCAGLFGVFAWKGFEEFERRAKATTEEYLDAVQSQRYNDAYDLLCEERQSSESRDEFVLRLEEEATARTLKDYEIKGVEIDSNSDHRVKVSLTYVDVESEQETTEREEYILVLEDNDFRIC